MLLQRDRRMRCAKRSLHCIVQNARVNFTRQPDPMYQIEELLNRAVLELLFCMFKLRLYKAHKVVAVTGVFPKKNGGVLKKCKRGLHLCPFVGAHLCASQRIYDGQSRDLALQCSGQRRCQFLEHNAAGATRFADRPGERAGAKDRPEEWLITSYEV